MEPWSSRCYHTRSCSLTPSRPPAVYTSAEMAAFGQAFDTLGYALDRQNFGAETDIDTNGRVAILFTPGVNVLPDRQAESWADSSPVAICSP